MQKEALAEPQYPALGSSSQRLLQVLLASLPTEIGSRLATSTMEPRSEWPISTPHHPNLQLYIMKTLAQHLESFSLHIFLLSRTFYLAFPSLSSCRDHHKSHSTFSTMSFLHDLRLRHEMCPGLQAFYRRNVTPKAWTSGMNPITQRSTISGHQNGIGPQAKNATHKATISSEGNIEKLANERLMYLMVNFMVSERDETKHT